MERFHGEEELILRFRGGDPEAFTLIYQKFYSRMYHFARRYVMDRQDAEDITADTFVKLWRQKATFPTEDAISAFLHVTTRNACFDFLRHTRVKTAKHQELLQLLEESKEAGFGLEEIREQLMKMIYAKVETFPQKIKEIFYLSYVEGLKPAEIAEQLNLSVQTVSNQKSSALKLLKLARFNLPLIVFLFF
ncbi:RNA polymerase sigma-70 factor [Flavitalea flava]